MLAILLGEFEVDEFVDPGDDVDTAMSICFLVAYIILVVIVMLNLLIAIVSRVYERCQVNYEDEFLRAKAQLICEIEQVKKEGREGGRSRGREIGSDSLGDRNQLISPSPPSSLPSPLLPSLAPGLLPR